MAIKYYDPFEARSSGRFPSSFPFIAPTGDFVFPDEMMGQGGDVQPGLSWSGQSFGAADESGMSLPLKIGLGIGALLIIKKLLEK